MEAMTEHRLYRVRRKQSRRGLNLVELVVSIGVVSIGLMALMAVLVASQRAAAHGATLSEATGHARHILELIRSDNGLAYPGGNSIDLPVEDTGLNDDLGGREPWELTAADFHDLPLLDKPVGVPTAQRGLSGLRDPGAPEGEWEGQRFRRTITAARLSESTSDYRFGLRKFTVSVYWLDEGVLRSTSVSGVTRLKNPSDD